MNKNVLSLVVVLMMLTTVEAQKLPWAVALGNSTNNFTSSVGTDHSGNIIISGFFKGSNLDFDPSTSGTANLSSVGDNDIFVAKYNNAGQYLWAFSLGNILNETADKMTIDSAGNIYVSGSFRGTLDFDPSPTDTFNLTSNGDIGTDPGFGGDAFLAKYSNDGTFLWAINAGSTSILDLGGAVSIDNNGDVLWSGGFTGTTDFDPSANVSTLTTTGAASTFLAKYSSTGNFIWVKGFIGTNIVNTTGRDIAVDKTGNIYFTGLYDGTIDLDPDTAVHNFASNGCQDFFLVKLDSTGQYKWGFNVGGLGCDYPWNMELDTLNNIYMTGFFSNTVDFNPGAVINSQTSKGGLDGFVVKYDENGNHLFSGSIGGMGDDYAFGLILTNNGFTISGSFVATADFDMGTNSYNLVSSGGADGYIARYDLNGNFENVFKIGGTQNEEARELTTYYDPIAYKSSVANPFNENLYVSGRFASANVDFDPSPSKLVYSTQGGDDIFLAKYTDLELVNYVKGTVFLDNNKNGIGDSGDTYTDKASILSYKSFGDSVLTGSFGGQFGFVTDTGSYTTKAVPYMPYYTAIPVLFNTNSSTYYHTDSVNFALQAIPGQRDLMVSLIPITPVRPGFGAVYKMLYQNNGTDTIASGTVEFVKDSRMLFINSIPAQNSISGDTIRWDYNNLKPGENGFIEIGLLAAAPPLINLDDTVHNTATIYPLLTDLTPADNTTDLTQVVIGSYDPNEKTEKHGGVVKINQLANDYLQYTIHFQNTGNDTAFNISLRDTLSAKLNWRTIQMLTSSHPYKFLLREGKFCEWTFSNIKLLDSNANSALSKGYVVFRIKSIAGLMAGDTISNRASIYFDYNAPIRTNVNNTIIVQDALPVKLISFNARRDGAENLVEWQTGSELNVDHYEIQRSANGRLFATIGNVKSGDNNYNTTYHYLDLEPLKSKNYYRLKIKDRDGKVDYSNIKLVNRENALAVLLFPNPANDQLTLQLESDKENSVNVGVYSVNGSLMFNQKISINCGTTIRNFNVSKLSSGSYLFKVYTAGEVQSIKFQKQ